MKSPHNLVKTRVIILWCLCTSLFLWYFALGIKPELDFFQYMNFCIMLFGSGVAYHVVTILIACPSSENNSSQWLDILLDLLVVLAGYAVIGCTLALGKYIGEGVGWMIAFVGLLSGMYWVLHFLMKLEKPIKMLVSSNQQSS